MLCFCRLYRIFRERKRASDGIAERLADALNEKDENKLNALFIPNVINESPSFTEDVKELFELYEGPFEKISKVQLRSSGDSVDSGMRTSYTSGVFTILAGGERYYCYMRAYYRNDINPENVGIEYLRVYSREAKVTSTTKNKNKDLMYRRVTAVNLKLCGYTRTNMSITMWTGK